jgi:hypothetical protein
MPSWFPYVFLAMGTFIILISLGVISLPPSRRRALLDGPRHWQVTCFGIAFFCAGLSFLIQKWKALAVANSVVLLGAFIAPMLWVLFFSKAVDLSMQIFGGICLLCGGGGGLFGIFRSIQSK